MLTSTLKSQIDKLRDIFRAGGIANPLTAIEQISFLIFMKRLDEIDQQQLLKAKKVNSFHYTSVFADSFLLNGHSYEGVQLRRSSRIQLPAEEMFPFVRDVVFPFLKTLHTDEGFAGSLKDANFLIPKASMLVSAVNTIEHLHITEQNEDTTGDLYEYLLNELSSAGKNGQFRTPRHIIKMMVKLVAPTKHDKIADLAVGTAGFLINAYKYLLQKNTSENGTFAEGETLQYAADLLSEKEWKKLKTETLYGFDIDTTMVRVALMNSIMHGISQPRINYQDTLGKQFSHKEEFDVILMNPPFKGSIDHGDIHPDFSLGTTKTELLFLELILNKLKVGGKAGVIVPDGVLFGASNAHKKIRELLVETTELKAVISLPSGVFKPYAGVSTAILIFTKGDETQKVWFYDVQADGFSLDDKRNPTVDNDIPDLLHSYSSVVRTRSFDGEPSSADKRFRVDKAEIKKNSYDLSISKYKKIDYLPVQYETPSVLLEQLQEIESRITKGVGVLEKMLRNE